jgi:signal transduction histidine kinase
MRRIILSCMLVFASTLIMDAPGATKNEAIAMTKKAIDFYKANGAEKAFEAIKQPNGKFHKGELYIYTYDMEGVVTSHPTNHGLIGKNVYNLKDTKGFEFVKYMVDNAKAKGSGWCEYYWTNPVTKKIGKKLSYFEKVDDIVFVCGVY